MGVSVKDSSYIEEKDVVLCKSGIQVYQDYEVENFNLDMEGHTKTEYRVYKAPVIVIAAKDMMRKLPVAKEHPPVDIESSNFDLYTKGITGDDLEVVAIGKEIGIQSSIAFFTEDLYKYYIKGAKMVSLGSRQKFAWASEEDQVKYDCDILVTEITSVNHLAVTVAGRGGKDVAIIDSLIGGIQSMKTGFIQYLRSKGKTNDSTVKVSEILFQHLEAAKGKTGDALGKEVAAVMDSVACLKDSPQKDQLVGIIQDSFTNPELVLANKEDTAKIMDSCYISISGDSLQEIAKALNLGHKEPDADNGVMDSKKKKDDGDDKEGKEDKKDPGVTDSSPDAIAQKVTDSILGKLPELLDKAVDAKMRNILLGGSDPEPKGMTVTDSVTGTGGTSADQAGVLGSVMQDYLA